MQGRFFISVTAHNILLDVTYSYEANGGELSKIVSIHTNPVFRCPFVEKQGSLERKKCYGLARYGGLLPICSNF